MSNFLVLSRELRDLIYIFVLSTANNPPPSSPADSGERQLSDEETFQGSKIYFPYPVHISSTALLLTNHQIHAEFAACIARLKKSGRLRYKLDCMLYEEESIYPTWLSVPVLSERIDVLEVDFRLFGAPDGDAHGYMGYWKGDLIAPGPVVWSLLALLERFLKQGPDFLSCDRDERKIRLDTLVLNVLDTSVPDEGSIPGYDRSRDNVMHSTHVVLAMSNAICSLLEGGTYPELIFDRVKNIHLCDDGHENRRWNLEAIPARLAARTPL